MDENSQPNSPENTAPTWADFKPPVVTTPFRDGGSLNIPQATPPPDELTQGFQPQPPQPDPTQPVTPPPPSPLTMAPEPTPPPEITAPAPGPTVQSVAPEVTLPPRDPIMDPAHELRPPTPEEIQASSNPPAHPPSSGGQRVLPLVLAAALVIFVAAGGIYFYLNGGLSGLNLNFGTGSQPFQQNPTGENLTILADSLGPDSWENNYSSGLLATERGGLEFVVTDPPPATSAASASARPASASATSTILNSLKITISKVEVHLATQTIEATGTSPEATRSANKSIDRWETLRLNQNTTVDLMALRKQAGALSSLGVTYLAAGHYTEVRLYITSASGETSDGEMIAIDLPGKNGIVKIVKPFDVTATGSVKLTVDFDAPRSVIKSGDKYQLLPVVGKVIYQGKEI